MRSHPIVLQRPEVPSHSRVELLGEPCDWLNPLFFGDGNLDLSLPTGVYSYKSRVDGSWTIDTSNPRTRSTRSGVQNSVLSVGGASEPLLFAPAVPFVVPLDHGTIRVLALLRRGHGSNLRLHWKANGGDWETIPMVVGLEEVEHLGFVCEVPASARFLRFDRGADTGPLLSDSGRAEYEISISSDSPDVPEWWREALVYTILVDRFRPSVDRPRWEYAIEGERRAGGHLEGVRRSLPYLKETGVTVIHLTPVHRGASSHRYDLVDPLRVDSFLGGDRALRALIGEAHAMGIRILLDFSFSHVGRGFEQWTQVERDGTKSEWADWFLWKGKDLVHYGTRKDAPVLNLRNAQVEALVLRAVDYWASFGIDGLRIDAAAEVPVELARRIRLRLRERISDAVVLAELVPQHVWRWDEALDFAYDFGFQEAVIGWLIFREYGAEDLIRRLEANELARGISPHRSMRFLSTHDHSRLDTHACLRGCRDNALLGLVMLLTWSGTPAIVYGEEIGLFATELRNHEDVWPDRMPMPWSESNLGVERRRCVRELMGLRKRVPAILRGECRVIYASGPTLVYERRWAESLAVIAVHLGTEPVHIDLRQSMRVDHERVIGQGKVRGVELELGACSAVVLCGEIG